MPVPKTTFKIFAPMLKTSLGADGKMRLHGVASSTIKDRHGDTMNLSALSDMENTAAQNMTIFLNHEYRVPEDVAGSVERAAISRSAQDPDIHDLSLDIVVNTSNERAVKAWEAINGGTKLGLSIGAMIPEGGATRDRKSGAYAIDHVELLETSLVGVPANPRSWVEYAVKALNGEPNGTLTSFVDGEMVVTDLEKDVALHPEDTDRIEEALEADEDAGDPAIETDLEAPVELAITSASADPLDTPEPPPLEADLSPDITDATVSVETPFANITIDTGNRGKSPDTGASQEAQTSAPENEGEEAEAPNPWAAIGLSGDEDIDAALQVLEPTVIASLSTSTDLLKAVTRELTETKKALSEAQEERKQALAAAEKALKGTSEILLKISSLPAGRRAVVKEASDDLAGLSAVYGEAFMNDLKKG